ncbi:protein of unknown function [Candidatus Hydrogenisulfobacillus filiaventi]|uniref:Uncharacterized protein n=1 Tax=Candidatus Hydrogenisulfobacillus filiaventi TaxID=2707344 RepID=A0A6F8ZH08_9FIRM|nr:protein of unknown function [Candidatus Hydrogenisulfobacillus filiaventi]
MAPRKDCTFALDAVGGFFMAAGGAAGGGTRTMTAGREGGFGCGSWPNSGPRRCVMKTAGSTGRRSGTSAGRRGPCGRWGTR